MLTEYFKAIIFGIVEGITEWLPISSTGHLILLEQVLTLNAAEGLGKEFARQYGSAFDVVIQFGAILAVVCVYFNKLFSFKKNAKSTLNLWLKLTVATIPAAVLGLLSDFLCEKYFGMGLDALLFRPQVVASALIIYGILFILVEKLTKDKADEAESVEDITLPTAFAIGCFQALAIVPGTSRSGSTVLGARILGVSRRACAEFSFFAAIPVITAASFLKLLDLGKFISAENVTAFTDAATVLILAGVTAFVVSMFAVKFLVEFLKKHTFVPFGIYRIILGVAVLIAYCR